MSSINFLSSGASPQISPTAPGKRPAPSAFELNSARFGPVAASAIGVAQATVPAASAVVSFSQAALKELSDAAEGVSDAVGEAVDFVEDGVSSLADGIVSLAHDGAEALESACDEGAKFVASVEHAVDSATTVIGDATSAVTDGLKTAMGNVAGYALLGAASVAGFINDVV